MRWLLIPSIALLSTGTLLARDVDYLRDVKPLLIEKCSGCHGALKQEAELRVDAATLIRKGGESGPAVVPGSASESLLFKRIATTDSSERMPPEGEGEPFTPEELALIRAWIERGTKAPADEPIPTNPRQHWAYQVPIRPTVPKIDDPVWSGNPIDAFVAQQHRIAKLKPVHLANKHTMVRRLYIDVIGLPPTRQQTDDFVRDASPDSHRKLVDELLNRPQYGERWGRHWMDVWRYSDWSGYKEQLRGSQRHIWRWRDWIIESLNVDKGYDQFIIEMLAGDEVAPDNFDVLRATGFLARNYHKSNRNIWLDATVEHTAKAFLGMTINCARCHDHKFDPISQIEYYAMRAIFEPHNVRTERVPGQSNLLEDGLPRVFDAEPNAETFLYIRGNEKHFDKENPVAAAVPAIFGRTIQVESISLPPVSIFPSLWPHIEKEETLTAESRVAAAKKKLEKQRAGHAAETNHESSSNSVNIASLELASAVTTLAALRARWAADKSKYLGDEDDEVQRLAKAAAGAEGQATVAAAKVVVSVKRLAVAVATGSDDADAGKKKQAIAKAQKDLVTAEKNLVKANQSLAADDAKHTSVGKVYPSTSTGRRLALARWIADNKNPLTARVAVNHIWMRHFGEPLVANVFDFGLRAPRPAQIDLLDWLAVELMEHDWSMKHLHRLILNSRVYQLASFDDREVTDVNQQRDADNLFLWRANVRRLDAEVIRDSLLWVGGSLDLTRGGPDIDFAKGESVPRRSIYFRHAYEKQMTMLALFDAAGPNECYRRSKSIIPQQALTLANSPLALGESRKLARALWRDVVDQSDAESRFVDLAFQHMLTRHPSQTEVATCLDFLVRQAAKLATPSALTDFGGKTAASVAASDDPSMRARENLVHVLMNHNDFVTIR
jgi:hypothetical protein